VTLDAADWNIAAGDGIVVAIERRTETSRKRPAPTEVIRVDVIDCDAAKTAPKFESVRTFLNLSEVVQLPTSVGIHLMPDLRAQGTGNRATTESSAHANYGEGIVAKSFKPVS